MERINLKIIPLTSYMKSVPTFNKSNVAYHQLKETKVRYNKENVYLLIDGKEKKCWFEVNFGNSFKAFEYSTKSFLCDMHEDDIFKIPKKIIEQLRVLKKEKILSDRQYEIIREYDTRMYIKNSIIRPIKLQLMRSIGRYK